VIEGVDGSNDSYRRRSGVSDFWDPSCGRNVRGSGGEESIGIVGRGCSRSVKLRRAVNC
jgi:hypothetical protein